MQNHKYSLTEIEGMLPWEREIYITMLSEDLKEQAEEAKRRNVRNL